MHFFFGIRPFAISGEVRFLSASLRSAGSDRPSRSEHSLSYSRKLKTEFCSRLKTNRGLNVRSRESQPLILEGCSTGESSTTDEEFLK